MRNGIEGQVRLHDSSFNIWEEPGTGKCDSRYESGFKRDVFTPLIKLLRARGWKVGRDKRIWRDYRILADRHRYCVHPARLEGKLEMCGRHIGLELYQNVENVEHRCGGEYDFNKLDRMPYLMRLRAQAEIEALVAWACTRFGYSLRRDEKKLGPGGVDADGYIRQHWETKRFPGDKPQTDEQIHSYNKRGRDCELRNGMRVYFTDHKGRWLTGIAEHNINNMWWVKCGRYCVRNVGSHDMREKPPADLRKKDNARLRRERLEQLMRKAANSNDFLRAEELRRVLFGEARLYRVRHREKGWYGIQSRGYSSTRGDAGQYTEDEAGFALESPDTYEVEAVDAGL